MWATERLPGGVLQGLVGCPARGGAEGRARAWFVGLKATLPEVDNIAVAPCLPEQEGWKAPARVLSLGREHWLLRSLSPGLPTQQTGTAKHGVLHLGERPYNSSALSLLRPRHVLGARKSRQVPAHRSHPGMRVLKARIESGNC